MDWYSGTSPAHESMKTVKLATKQRGEIDAIRRRDV